MQCKNNGIGRTKKLYKTKSKIMKVRPKKTNKNKTIKCLGVRRALKKMLCCASSKPKSENIIPEKL